MHDNKVISSKLRTIYVITYGGSILLSILSIGIAYAFYGFMNGNGSIFLFFIIISLIFHWITSFLFGESLPLLYGVKRDDSFLILMRVELALIAMLTTYYCFEVLVLEGSHFRDSLLW